VDTPSRSRIARTVIAPVGLVVYSCILVLGAWRLCNYAAAQEEAQEEEMRPYIYRDESEVPVEGEILHRYGNGKVKRQDLWDDGLLHSARWFSPAGDLIREEVFIQDETSAGVMVHLRDDGTPRRFTSWANTWAEGLWMDIDEDGRVTAVYEYHHTLERVWPASAQHPVHPIVAPPSAEEGQGPE